MNGKRLVDRTMVLQYLNRKLPTYLMRFVEQEYVREGQVRLFFEELDAFPFESEHFSIVDFEIESAGSRIRKQNTPEPLDDRWTKIHANAADSGDDESWSRRGERIKVSIDGGVEIKCGVIGIRLFDHLNELVGSALVIARRENGKWLGRCRTNDFDISADGIEKLHAGQLELHWTRDNEAMAEIATSGQLQRLRGRAASMAPARSAAMYTFLDQLEDRKQ